jgi:hypothetical protein
MKSGWLELVGLVKTRSVYSGVGGGPVGMMTSGSFKTRQVCFMTRTVCFGERGGQVWMMTLRSIKTRQVCFRTRKGGLVGRINGPAGMMKEVLVAMSGGEGGALGWCVRVKSRGHVGSDGVVGGHIESGGLVGIVCFGRAGESGGRVRDNRGRVRKMRTPEKNAGTCEMAGR